LVEQVQGHVLIGLVLVNAENLLNQLLSSHFLWVTLIQHLDVLEELNELLLDLSLLRQLLNVIVRGILDALLKQLELDKLLPHKRLLVNQLDQQVGAVEALSEGHVQQTILLVDHPTDQLLPLRTTHGKELIGALGQVKLKHLLRQLFIRKDSFCNPLEVFDTVHVEVVLVVPQISVELNAATLDYLLQQGSYIAVIREYLA